MSRDTVEGNRKLDLARLKQLGLFSHEGVRSANINWSNSRGEHTGDIQIIIDTTSQSIGFDYKIKESGQGEESWRPHAYRYSLEKIPCHYGGFRWFVKCDLTKNGVFCGRRVRVLYFAGDYLGCRNCAGLTYDSCNQSGLYKGFISIPDLEAQEAKIGRKYYAGKPTRKYRRFLNLEERMNRAWLVGIQRLRSRSKKQ